jgi:GT2 family glycosyltransferase
MGAYRTRQTTPAALFSQLEFEERYRMLRRRPQIDFVATYSAAYSKAAFDAVGGFDESMPRANNEDTELSYRLSEAGCRIVFVPEAIVEHEHDATWGSYWRTKFGRGYWRTLVYRRFPGKAVRDSYTPLTLKLQMPFALLALLGVLLALLQGRPRRLLLGAPFLATTVPLLRVALSTGSPAWPWTAWGSWLRATALLAGVVKAVLGSQRDLLAQAPAAKVREGEAVP